MTDTLYTRWQSLSLHIEKLQQAAPLARPPVTFIAVSKTQPATVIEPLLALGHRVFGENRVQEAELKWPALMEKTPDIALHLIGSLQTNKVKEALLLFHVIHTIDRIGLVDAIIKERTKGPTRCDTFFIQVNTGEEAQKGGVAPSETQALIEYCRAAGLPIAGLMCVPPADAVPAPHFALLHSLAEKFSLPFLSMGMSHDYEAAIRMGATHVRIGTALFGDRVY